MYVKKTGPVKLCLAMAAIMALPACAQQSPAPQMGRLTRSFMMVDQEGRPYGHIMLDPLGGGKVVDAEGRIIGYVVGAEQ